MEELAVGSWRSSQPSAFIRGCISNPQSEIRIPQSKSIRNRNQSKIRIPKSKIKSLDHHLHAISQAIGVGDDDLLCAVEGAVERDGVYLAADKRLDAVFHRLAVLDREDARRAGEADHRVARHHDDLLALADKDRRAGERTGAQQALGVGE